MIFLVHILKTQVSHIGCIHRLNATDANANKLPRKAHLLHCQMSHNVVLLKWMLSGQFVDKPTRGQSSRRLVNSARANFLNDKL